MILYFFPGACSLAAHIALREAGINFSLQLVDLSSGKVEDGRAFREINPKGYVPALQFDDGQVLTENVAVLQYIADRDPSWHPAGSLGRYRLVEWLAFINSEVHKAFAPLFSETAGNDVKSFARAAVIKRFHNLRSVIGPTFLMGAQFTVADAYLFAVLSWSGEVGMDLSQWPELQDYCARVGVRPCVKAALAAESSHAA